MWTAEYNAAYVSESSRWVQWTAIVGNEGWSITVEIPLNSTSIEWIFIDNVNHFLWSQDGDLLEKEELYIQQLLATKPAEAQRELLSLREIKRKQVWVVGDSSY